ncbi:hypothetical protein OH773_22250 (plasmid) [Buttiauxella sp. WJP83]|uniref:hypothetical protein n=1 Tax=Buttiauxella sp. WJP83 TaxID=2986951 RepID=UPI0022DDAE25|nr:hypothetical protein [Buttiauxella sp. WJP83]WBM72968.1 hypothetical protein OH773_22250 [Buttiauxella sp. WJP83]
MYQKCNASAAEMNTKFESMDAAELVKMLAIVRGIERTSIPERLIAVAEFASLFDEPMQIVDLAHHLGVHYLAEKERADKLQATLEMVSEPVRPSVIDKSAEDMASKDREIAGLKSSIAMLMAAFKLMSAQSAFKMPDLKSDDPMAVRQLLGAMADQLDATRNSLEDMMRELTHRHDLNKQLHKMQRVNH